jgi:hypothetical protein
VAAAPLIATAIANFLLSSGPRAKHIVHLRRGEEKFRHADGDGYD